eukprot:765542-Hanusia_phi.AAC.4
MEAQEPPRRQREVNWNMLTPLIWAPTIPLSRIMLKNNPVWRNRVFFSCVGVRESLVYFCCRRLTCATVFAHGLYMWPQKGTDG